MKRKKSESSIKQKLTAYIIFNLIILLGSSVAWVFKTNFLVYLLISFLPASIYLLSLIHKARGKIIAISVFWGLIASQILDSIAHISRSYTVISAFPFRIIATPFECYIWGLLFCVIILAGYEYFFDKSSTKTFSKNYKYGNILIIGLFTLFLSVFFVIPTWLNISYFYLTYVVIVILLDIFVYFKFKKFFSGALFFSIIYLPACLIHEITSLELGYWLFHFENLVGKVSILGFAIPIEEILFFIISPIILIACYEFFVDNNKA